MSERNVSAPVFETPTGWFRYNYDKGQLEFIRNDNKMISGSWPVPADQWDSLPSKQAYCEQIFVQEQKHADEMAKSNQRANTAFFAWAPLVIVSIAQFFLPIPDIAYPICFIIGFIGAVGFIFSKR